MWLLAAATGADCILNLSTQNAKIHLYVVELDYLDC